MFARNTARLARYVVGLLALVWVPGSLFGFEAPGVLRKVDADNSTVVVQAGGQERTVKVAADAKFTDEKGAPLADGLKSAQLKPGAEVTLSVEPDDGQPVIRAIQLGRRERPGGGAPNGGAGAGFDAQVELKKIDLDAGTITVTGGGQEHTAKVNADATFADEKGGKLAEGLKSPELMIGAVLTLHVVPGPGGPTISSIRLGRHGTPGGPGRGGAPSGPAPEPKPSVGLKPLTEMTSGDHYKGEAGGLYGAGSNEPPAPLAAAAKEETAKIAPLDADGQPSPSGKIGLVSISMSNATMEFSRFKQVADNDPEKSPRLSIVDCAQGGQTMARWASPDAPPWREAERRLEQAGVSPKQVQVAWVKLANAGPNGDLADHGKQLERDTEAVLRSAKQKFPSLRIAYLSSRIYGGWASTRLNPEPYAYEGAFVVRWVIQDQLQGNPELNFNAQKGEVKAPLALWGPYLWADGTTPRQSDGLVWQREDLAGDGTHPSDKGRQKVAELMLKFFKTDPNARTWFVGK